MIAIKTFYLSILVFVAITFFATAESGRVPSEKRQLDPNFGQSLESSIEAQNSAIQSSVATLTAGIQSSISQQGISLSSMFQSITVSHSTMPFTQPSNGVCNGSLINGQCCTGPVVNNICYSPNANKSGGSSSSSSNGSQTTPAPTSGTSSSGNSSGNSTGNSGAKGAHWGVGLVAFNLFVVSLFLWS